MNEPTKKSIVNRLTIEFEYPKRGANIIVQKIRGMQSPLRLEFYKWWHTGDIPTFEVEGYTLVELMSEHNMNPIAAFLTLDWILREPAKAKASLERGHDQVFRK